MATVVLFKSILKNHLLAFCWQSYVENFLVRLLKYLSFTKQVLLLTVDNASFLSLHCLQQLLHVKSQLENGQ